MKIKGDTVSLVWLLQSMCGGDWSGLGCVDEGCDCDQEFVTVERKVVMEDSRRRFVIGENKNGREKKKKLQSLRLNL